MWLYFGREYTAARSGSTIRDVTCEKCGSAYHYELARTGVGKAQSPYYLNNRGAARRSEDRAANHLRKLLLSDLEAVPCPQCGWIQADMVRWIRRDRFRWISTLALFGGGAALVILLVVFVVQKLDRYAEPGSAKSVLTWMAIVAAIAAALLTLRRTLANMVDPNRDYPKRPQRRPGTPPALVRDPSDPSRYVPAREDEQTAMAGEWAEVQLQRVELPAACCTCLGPADRAYKVPFVVRDAPLAVPLCAACNRSIQGRWWLWALASLLIGAAAGGVLLFLETGDEFGRIFLGVIAFLFVGLFAVAMLPEWRVRPYRMKTVDASRGVVRLRFANPQYTELLAQTYVDGAAIQRVAPPPLPATGAVR